MSSNVIECSGNARVSNVKQTSGKNLQNTIKVCGNARVKNCKQQGSPRRRERRRRRSRSPSRSRSSNNTIVAADMAIVEKCEQFAPRGANNIIEKDGSAHVVGCR